VPDTSPDTAPDELGELWGRVSEDLRRSLPETTFDLWLRPLRAAGAAGTTLYLTGPPAVRTWVERRYLEPIAAAVARQSQELERVSFVAEDTAAKERPRLPQSRSPEPGHVFERFVIGPGNRLAHAAALAVAELPGEAYNPLFLHGPPGLGKSHLLGAIAEYLQRNHPERTVHLTTAERFTAEFVAALRQQGPDAFKRHYRELDALLIDDVQFLEGKPRTEEEFVHTFNALHSAGKQIVLSSDRPPEALEKLAERLRDRFRWGLCVSLEPPDLRTRVALLWRMAARSVPEIADPVVLREIASRAPGNVRLLEGTMTRVVAFASMLSEPISGSLVERALGGGTPEAVSRRPGAEVDVEAIQEAVAAVLDVPRSELLSARRTPRVAQARQLAMYLCRDLTPLSLAQIARAFDRDHSTVLHAVRAVSARIEPGSETAEAIHSVKQSLGRAAPPENARSTSRPDPPLPSHTPRSPSGHDEMGRTANRPQSSTASDTSEGDRKMIGS
jgi:chromosomal replication initiator protein